MKIKNFVLTTLLSFMTAFAISAQDCKLYFPDKTGAVREISHFDKKDKFTGKTIQEILSKNSSGGNIKIDVKTTIFDEEEAEVTSMEMEVVCEDGVFKIDMTDYLSEMLEAYQEMEVEMKGDNLRFPSNMKVGDRLEDAAMNIIVRTGGMQIMNMTVNITNRIVEGKETISTPAGSFECYKIVYDTQSKTKIINVQTSAAEWIAEGVGIVKTENYNKKGKLESYMLLTGLEK